MQVTLYGGPHDGRRITIDPAVARTGRVRVPDPVESPAGCFSSAEEYPTAPLFASSTYRAPVVTDGPPDGSLPPYWFRWEYERPR